MLQITSYKLNTTPLKNSVNFGDTASRRTESYEDGKLKEEISAAKLEQFAKAVEESENPSSLKSFTIIAALMSASALTASALGGRFFNLLNGVGAIKKASKITMNVIEKAGEKLAQNTGKETGVYKTKARTYAQKIVEYLQDTSKNGIEDQLNKLKSKRATKITSIKRAIKKANPNKTYTKEELAKAFEEAVANNKTYQDDLDKIDNIIKDLKGSNLLKKSTKVTSAAVAGTAALKEAATDNNEDGIPDCAQYKKAKNKATKQVAAVILDAALDNFC